MAYRMLMRFIGEGNDLASLWDEFICKFPEAELPDADSGEWYSVNDVMTDDYECRFEELPLTELLAMDGSIYIEDEFPEEFMEELMERYERVYGVFKWSSFDVGVGCGSSEAWGEFTADFADDFSDEANEISEAVLGF